jgi:hypothetical protein
MRATGDPLAGEIALEADGDAPDPWDLAPYRGPLDPAAAGPEDR